MTTDTALLVSKEILEDGKTLSGLKFTENPEIPTDDNVKSYLDMRLSIDNLVNGDISVAEGENNLYVLRKEMVEKDIPLFEQEI